MPLPDYVGSGAATPGSSMRPSAGRKAGRRPADLRLRETPDYHVERRRASWIPSVEVSLYSLPLDFLA